MLCSLSLITQSLSVITVFHVKMTPHHAVFIISDHTLSLSVITILHIGIHVYHPNHAVCIISDHTVSLGVFRGCQAAIMVLFINTFMSSLSTAMMPSGHAVLHLRTDAMVQHSLWQSTGSRLNTCPLGVQYPSTVS